MKTIVNQVDNEENESRAANHIICELEKPEKSIEK